MKTNKQSDQRGMVSIIITMIMMIVITLIVLGFTQVARRNERESLDSQLGTQAYYAAETGVNDAVTQMNQLIASGGTVSPRTDCSPAKIYNVAASPVLPRALAGTAGAVNTCLMLTTQPSTLKIDSVGPGSSKQLHLQNASGGNFGSLTFAWTPDGGGSGSCSNAIGSYPQFSNWNCTHAILRVDILKGNPPAFDAATLADNTVSLYLQPIGSGSAISPTIATFPGNTKAYQGSCIPNGGVCSVTVTLGAAAQSTDYYVRLSTLYLTAPQVTLSATKAGGGTALFSNGQFVIDSTGRAQDQIKRIQVRVPYTPSNAAPAYAVLSTNTVCKDLAVAATVTTLCPAPWPNP